MEDESTLAGGKWQYQADQGFSLSQIALNKSPGQIIVSNVAGTHLKQEVIAWAAEAYSLPVHFVMASTEAHGVRNAYDIPGDLGSDRWLTLIAAHALYQADICIIDAGSAITIDLLTAKGTHLGGYILPGFTSMSLALTRDTGLTTKTPGLSQSAGLQPGNSTVQCIENGSLIAAVSAIEGVVKHFEMETGEKVQCVLTGGDATQLSDKLHISHLLEPALVLKGMAIVGKHLAQTL